MKTILTTCLFALLSCSKNEQSANLDSGLILNQKIMVEGSEREYHHYIPDEPSERPLVILLHGNGGSSDQTIGRSNTASPQKLWTSIAAREKIHLLIPNGSIGPSGRRGWNDCRSDASGQTTTDDVAFLQALLEEVETRFAYNANSVYVAGISNGGFMANRLALEIPEKITAIAAVTAAMPNNSECVPKNVPISVLFMNGTEDPIVPFNGGEMAFERGSVLSAQESIAYWNDVNGTTGNPIIETVTDSNANDQSTVVKYSYTNQENNTETLLFEVRNGGHTAPSIEERYGTIFLELVGNQNSDIETAEEIWAFFKGKSR